MRIHPHSHADGAASMSASDAAAAASSSRSLCNIQRKGIAMRQSLSVALRLLLLLVTAANAVFVKRKYIRDWRPQLAWWFVIVVLCSFIIVTDAEVEEQTCVIHGIFVSATFCVRRLSANARSRCSPPKNPVPTTQAPCVSRMQHAPRSSSGSRRAWSAGALSPAASSPLASSSPPTCCNCLVRACSCCRALCATPARNRATSLPRAERQAPPQP